MDAVASSLGADIDDRIPFSRCARVEDFVLFHQAEGKRIDQRIARVAGFEFRFATEIGHTEAVAVGGYTADHAFQDGVVFVDLILGRGRLALLRLDSRGGCPYASCDRAEAQGIHHCDRPRAHSEDVAQDSAHAGGRALKRLDERRVIVRFDLERAGPAVADVDDAGVLSRALQDELAARGQPLQVHARGFVGAVLAPHHAEDAEFGQGGLASAEKLAGFSRIRRA